MTIKEKAPTVFPEKAYQQGRFTASDLYDMPDDHFDERKFRKPPAADSHYQVHMFGIEHKTNRTTALTFRWWRSVYAQVPQVRNKLAADDLWFRLIRAAPKRFGVNKSTLRVEMEKLRDMQGSRLNKAHFQFKRQFPKAHAEGKNPHWPFLLYPFLKVRCASPAIYAWVTKYLKDSMRGKLFETDIPLKQEILVAAGIRPSSWLLIPKKALNKANGVRWTHLDQDFQVRVPFQKPERRLPFTTTTGDPPALRTLAFDIEANSTKNPKPVDADGPKEPVKKRQRVVKPQTFKPLHPKGPSPEEQRDDEDDDGDLKGKKKSKGPRSSSSSASSPFKPPPPPRPRSPGKDDKTASSGEEEEDEADVFEIERFPFPDPTHPEHCALAISSVIHNSQTDEMENHIHCLGPTDPLTDKSVKVHVYEKERDMINGWRDFVVSNNIHVITGWNTQWFDWRFLMERMRQYPDDRFWFFSHLVDHPCEIKVASSSTNAQGAKESFMFREMPGIQDIDELNFIRENRKMPDYKLNTAAKICAKVSKIDMPINEVFFLPCSLS